MYVIQGYFRFVVSSCSEEYILNVTENLSRWGYYMNVCCLAEQQTHLFCTLNDVVDIMYFYHISIYQVLASIFFMHEPSQKIMLRKYDLA